MKRRPSKRLHFAHLKRINTCEHTVNQTADAQRHLTAICCFFNHKNWKSDERGIRQLWELRRVMCHSYSFFESSEFHPVWCHISHISIRHTNSVTAVSLSLRSNSLSVTKARSFSENRFSFQLSLFFLFYTSHGKGSSLTAQTSLYCWVIMTWANSITATWLPLLIAER